MSRYSWIGLATFWLLAPVTLLWVVEPATDENVAPPGDWLALLSTEAERLQREQVLLDEKLQHARKRLAQKSEVGRQLLEGRLTIAEAAREFQRLDGEQPDICIALRQRFPGAEGIELHARAAVEAALNQIGDGASAHEASQRLAAALEHWCVYHQPYSR